MKTRLLLLAVLAAAAPAAGAQAAAHALKTFIAEQDLDKDGTVTKEEYQQGRDERFAATDADKDGGLSKAEYVGEYTVRLNAQLPSLPADRREEEQVRQLRQADVRFGVLDSNKDGAISPAEYASSGWTMFATHDKDRSGSVSIADEKPTAVAQAPD